MAVVPAFLGSAQLTTTTAPVLTVASGVHAVIKSALFTNITGSAATVTVYRVPSGDTAGSDNAVLLSFSVAANTAYIARELQNIVLGPGDSIQAKASAGASINVWLDGFVY